MDTPVIESYKPNPKQLEFHLSQAINRAFIGGFGSGKSKTIIWEGIDLSMRYAGNRGCILRDTMSDLRDSTQQQFFDECPEEFIASYRKKEETIMFVNGSQILFRSFRQYKSDRRNQFEGKIKALNLGWWGIDEGNEIEENEFLLLQGRLRLNTVPRHCGFLATNPPSKDHWIYKYFDAPGVDRSKYLSVHASTRDNQKHLPADYISNMERNYSPSWIQKFIDGEYGFVVNGSPAYEGFNEDWHCPKIFPGHSDTVPVHRYWDFGYRRPAVVWAQKTPDGQWRIYKELLGNNEHLQQFAPRVLQISNERFPGCTFVDYCDPAGNQKKDTGKPSVEVLREQFKIRCTFRPTLISDGVEIIQRCILTMVHTEPALIINKSECTNIVNGFIGGFATANGEIVKDGYYEHLHDALRYGAINVFGSNQRDANKDFPIGGPSYATGSIKSHNPLAMQQDSPWRLTR